MCRRFPVPVDLLGGLWPGGDVLARAFVELAGLTMTVSARGHTELARSQTRARLSAAAARTQTGPVRDRLVTRAGRRTGYLLSWERAAEASGRGRIVQYCGPKRRAWNFV